MANNINNDMSTEALTEVDANGSNSNMSGVNTTTSTTTIAGDNSNINHHPSSQHPTHSTSMPNDTISAAADSSDNQPDQQSLRGNGVKASPVVAEHLEQQQQQQQQHQSSNEQQTTQHHHPPHSYPTYGGVPPSLYSTGLYKSLNPSSMNSRPTHTSIHQQQQQQQPTLYPSYLNSYQQFYQEQQQQQHQHSTHILEPMDYMTTPSNLNDFYGNPAGGGNISGLDESKQAATGIRYHPYNLPQAIPTHTSETEQPTASSSPKIVSSTSPTTNNIGASNLSNHIAGVGNDGGANNSNTPTIGTNYPCTKCGFTFTTEIGLQDHIKFIHTSPYQNRNYTTTPTTNATPSGSMDQAQNHEVITSHAMGRTMNSGNNGVAVGGGGGGGGVNVNPGEILDLDSQKLLYPPGTGSMNPVNISGQPLYSMHSMQQSGDMSVWNQQQTADGALPPYMAPQQQVSTTDTKPIIPQSNSPFNRSPKQSPFSGSSIKSEYSGVGVKSEFTTSAEDNHEFTLNTQQPVMTATPIMSSGSPAEFPSTTTTEGFQDVQQQSLNQSHQPSTKQRQSKNGHQYRGSSKNGGNGTANFEAPTSSSAMSGNSSGSTKAANWKSNEPRRPKTYNCTACNKWFTSSGHLKRHYNTTLHKNAVKQSGKPDPCTLPISQFHHPSRDPNSKVNRRGNGDGGNNNSMSQRQQQRPAPVQPPDPSNQTPTNVNNVASMNSFANAASPNSGSYVGAVPTTHPYHQQQQGQFLAQCQTTTAAPSVITGEAVSTIPYEQTEIMNGHPNGLAGLSVQTTTMSMPSSPVRGLLNLTSPTTATAITSISQKNEREAATVTPMQDQLTSNQIPLMQIMQTVTHYPMHEEESITLDATETTTADDQVWVWQQELVDHCVPPHQLAAVPPPLVSELAMRHSPQLLDLDLLRQVDQTEEHNYNHHHIPPLSMHREIRTPHITSQGQAVSLQGQQQSVPTNNIFSLMLPQQPLQQLPNITEVQQRQPQPYPPTTPLDINMQPNNTLQQQLPATTIHILTPIPTTPINMDNSPANLVPHTALQPLTTNTITTTQPLDNIINMPQHLPQSQHIMLNNSNTTPMCHQPPQQQDSLLQHQLEPIQISPHTTIGNYPMKRSNTPNLDIMNTNANVGTTTITTNTFASTASNTNHTFTTVTPSNAHVNGGSCIRQISPRQGDLPPNLIMSQYDEFEVNNSMMVNPALITVAPNNIHGDNNKENINIVYEQQNYHYTPAKKSKLKTKSPRKAPKTKNEKSDGPHICEKCNKKFTSQCYLTQHNDKIHSGKYEFRCKMCGKGYNDVQIFEKHVKCHTNPDKDYKCTYASCTKQYNHKSDLTRHIRLLHENNLELLHTCKICGKSFCRNDHLRNHVLSHEKRSKKGGKRGYKVKQNLTI